MTTVAGGSIADVAGTVHRFARNTELGRELAARVAGDLRAALVARESATLAVSGGSTPVPFFDALARESLDWARVLVAPVDERWVSEDHADSNAALIRAHLLQQAAASARFLGLYNGASTPFAAEAALTRQLSPFARGIDVVVLGMGEDGHTASFFPGARTLKQALDPQSDALCVAVEPPQAAHQRMSLSLAALLRARHAYLHITGAGKWAVLQAAQASCDVARWPVAALLHAPGFDLDIYYASEN
ncbi:MAG: 6-phosphogluconolactonase [Halioglobus sp.]